MKVRIASNLTLPADVVTQTVAILAKRRAGKSYTARRFAEQILRLGQQLVIVDPKGDWWGIRSSADGRAPGFPITILGGEHGDAPLEANAGELIAKLVAEESASLLLDLSGLRKHEVATFMAAFLEAVYRLKAQDRYRTPMMLVVDEADAVAPQRPMKGEERMLGAAEDIVRRGGQRGIGCVLISQRAAVLNKNVLTQAEILVALRTIAPQDMEALDEWIKKHGTAEQRAILMESLPSLPVGDAWFWSPGWPTEEGIFERVHVLPIETFDSGATPKAGEKRARPRQAATVDIEQLRRRMAEVIERAEQDDPKKLRARIARLEREAAKKTEGSLTSEGYRRDIEAAYQKGLADGASKAGKMLAATRRAMLKAVERIQAAIPSEEFTGELPDDSSSERGNGASAFGERFERAARTRPRSEPNGNGAGLGGAQQRILNALAELSALGVADPPRVQVAFLAGYTNLNSKGFVNAIGALRSAGMIDYPNAGAVRLADHGWEHAHPSAAPRSSAELQERLIAMLGGANGRIIRELVTAYPDSIPREQLAARSGYTNLNSKGFVNAIGRLRTLGFIDYPAPGQVRAEDLLFIGAAQGAHR